MDELGDSYFIDELNEKKLLTNIIANQEYSLYDPINGKDYTITIDYKSGTQKILNGTFDKNGLPNDYECFIDDVQNFMDCHNANEIFDSSIYSKLPRKINELIFCSVIFEDGGKTYYYITEDDSLEVGDVVIVPAGKGNHEAAVRIVGIDHFTRDEAPLPLEKVKRIIRKRDKI
ncbi:MAG: hypothetical protein LUH54_03230 [Firmicutes bacterium]|nr:hypothetical protein [Bacillota bacterium]